MNFDIRPVRALGALLFVNLCLGGAALANDQDLTATTVPASACAPLNASQANRVRLSNGAWVFNGSSTGSVTFFCPLPRNNRTLSSATNDNNASRFRVFYRDTDGTANAANVVARLTYRTSGGFTMVPGVFNSNGSVSTGNTTGLRTINHNFVSSSLYAFMVTLRRVDATQDPSFNGIDFPGGLILLPPVLTN